MTRVQCHRRRQRRRSRLPRPKERPKVTYQWTNLAPREQRGLSNAASSVAESSETNYQTRVFRTYVLATETTDQLRVQPRDEVNVTNCNQTTVTARATGPTSRWNRPATKLLLKKH